ncbi:squalene/phytoene synthase family protein [Pelagibacteraceae bacterium]|jgi:phytoene synthase|nr:squalene/phytoene synthase family protein [Pelagibacteraceae bacterium]
MDKNQSLISKHAKSFSWAGVFLSKETFRKCSILYDFCRTVDDIADKDGQLDVKKKRFLEFKSEFKNKNFSNNIIKNIHKLLKEESISHKIVDDLFDGVETDLKNEVNLNTKKNLLIYSYRVAGTVGLMMAKILKVKNQQSLRCAVDLGVAMQLTNIARDVVEDKNRNRIYIKADFNSISNTIFLADIFYQQSFSSIKDIPIFSRFAILVARRIYKRIGYVILSQKNIETYNNAGKIYVSVLGKIIETFLSFFDFIKLFFVNSNEQEKQNEHIMLHKEINLDERI